MSPFDSISLPFPFQNGALRPEHMTLADAHPTLSSLVRTIGDYSHSHGHGHGQARRSPRFDVRESDAAFFLEGEVPGMGHGEDIVIEKLGPRTLLVKAVSRRFDIVGEWGGVVVGGVEGEREGGADAEGGAAEAEVRRGPVVGHGNGHGHGNGAADQDQDWDRDRDHAVGEGETKEEREERKEVKVKHRPEEDRLETDEDGLIIRLAERRIGSLQRSFTFPSAVDIDSLRARLRHGLLVMMVPKLGGSRMDSSRIRVED